jgi:hypothetical protein
VLANIPPSWQSHRPSTTTPVTSAFSHGALLPIFAFDEQTTIAEASPVR